jgi:sugar-specific transcriptional regulator TrmB
MSAENLLKEKVVLYLRQLGLNDEQALTYLFLLKEGPQTVLQLSRGLKTGRTKLYVSLEYLATKQLISIHKRHYGTSYEAQSPDMLEFLISEEERKAKNLRESLKPITHALKLMHAQSPAISKIIEYNGVDGLKQMNFNLTKAVEELHIFELEDPLRRLGKHFTEKQHQMWLQKKVTIFKLTNDQDWKQKAEARGYEQRFNTRYINPKTLTITFETYIYNNCVTLLRIEQNDVSGVEIYNATLARQQIQLFNLVWTQAASI